MAIRRGKKRKPSRLEKEIKEVETYEYLLVEYMKEISNEMTYLVLIVCSLFLFIILDVLPITVPEGYDLGIIRVIFILLICGGFALFGLSNITKRRIEKKFELIFR